MRLYKNVPIFHKSLYTKAYQSAITYMESEFTGENWTLEELTKAGNQIRFVFAEYFDGRRVAPKQLRLFSSLTKISNTPIAFIWSSYFAGRMSEKPRIMVKVIESHYNSINPV